MFNVRNSVVNSFDEWSQLEEVIVGVNDGFNGFHFDNTFDFFFWDNVKQYLKMKNYFRLECDELDRPVIKPEDYILEELDEDIQGIVDALTNQGVIVRRPESNLNLENDIRTPFWRSNRLPALNVRDNTIVLGSTIIETAPHVRARIFENDTLKPLFCEYFNNGANWVSMPRPTLSLPIDTSFFTIDDLERQVLSDEASYRMRKLTEEIIFDGAQCVRLGKDVLVNVSNRSHELAFQWLSKNFGEIFIFHRLLNLSDGHIDTMLLPLRPGLWLLRKEEYLEYLPEPFKKWEYIIPPECKMDMFPCYTNNRINLTSRYIDMNVLSINEKTVIVNSLYPELIETLERNGFNVVPVRHRHRRLIGGGFHCFTLDIRRKGGLISYAG
jgi:glycine amidinotransferase